MSCIGEPISWLRLEQHVRAADPQVDAHVATCPACRRCLDELRDDVVALPVLTVPEPRRRWWQWVAPALAVAAIVALVVRPRPPENVATIKGVGEVVLDVVRERGGVIRDDVRSFAPGDRWKVVVTCPPAAGAWIDVVVGNDHPIAPAHIACGNRVVVPGAFELTGDAPNRVCVRVGVDGAPPRTGRPDACVTIAPD